VEYKRCIILVWRGTDVAPVPVVLHALEEALQIAQEPILTPLFYLLTSPERAGSSGEREASSPAERVKLCEPLQVSFKRPGCGDNLSWLFMHWCAS
jgi:hypothetical protein